MTITVENGWPAKISFGGVIDRAAHVVPRGGVWQVAIYGEVRELRGIETVSVDGHTCAIIEPPEKSGVKGAVRLTLQPPSETAAPAQD
jgi:hypothetical protein